MQLGFQYNILGQRISRIELINGVTNTEYYVHDGTGSASPASAAIVADLDEDKELLRSYSYALGYDNIISMTSYGDTETNTYFYIRNHNNSVVALVDEDGSVAESYTYTAYGEVTVFDSNGNELDFKGVKSIGQQDSTTSEPAGMMLKQADGSPKIQLASTVV